MSPMWLKYRDFGNERTNPAKPVKGEINLLVSDAAKQLGMSTQTLRLALRQRLFPFGVAVKTSENRFTYHINPVILERYLKGEILDGNFIRPSRSKVGRTDGLSFLETAE